MLDDSAIAIGIGHVYFNGYHYWVQEFGNPASVAAAEQTRALPVLKTEVQMENAWPSKSSSVIADYT